MSLITGAFNTHAINEIPINGEGFTFVVGGGGAVASIAQNVGAVSTTSIAASLTQVVELHSTSTSAVVVSVAQAVKALGTKTIDVDQIVTLVSAPTTFYGRNGYEPMLYIGGVRVDNDEIHDLIEVVYTEDDAPQLRFTLIPPTGIQDVRSYRGKSVVYNIRESSGITRMFSGKINNPVVNILNQKISFNCSLDIEQTVETLMTRNQLNQIGYYNNEVFSNPETQLQELKDRVSTIPSVINFRKTGEPAVDLIATAASPHYTLTDSDVYRRDIDFKLGSGQRYLNKVNLKVQYSYQRLHHHERTFSAGVGYSSPCDLLGSRYTILTRALVGTAVSGSSWPVKGTITYIDIYPSGWYSCSGGLIGWSTQQTTGKTVDKVDAFGDPVLHNGVPVKENVITSIKDNTLALCAGASWTATTRFSQNIKTDYTISVEAPQSQTQNGVKERDLSFTLTSSFESTDWENYRAYTTNTPLAITGTSGANYWIDAATNKTLFDQSVSIMLNKAKSDILKSHREDKVIFKRSLWTAVDLSHTIKLNCTKIVATGRVYTYTHSINCSTGEAYTSVELSLSQSTGSASDDSLTLPGVVTNTPSYPSGSVNLGNGHYGKDPTQAGAESWTGHIGNKVLGSAIGPTQYPVSFVVDTPDIGPNLRQQLTLTSSTSYDVSIPNDSLTINFDQWT